MKNKTLIDLYKGLIMEIKFKYVCNSYTINARFAYYFQINVISGSILMFIDSPKDRKYHFI